MSLKIKSFEFNAFQENTFIVSDTENNAVIIDPGCYSRDEERQLITYINHSLLKGNQLKKKIIIKKIFNLWLV